MAIVRRGKITAVNRELANVPGQEAMLARVGFLVYDVLPSDPCPNLTLVLELPIEQAAQLSEGQQVALLIITES
jgi:hypothetical protein